MSGDAVAQEKIVKPPCNMDATDIHSSCDCPNATLQASERKVIVHETLSRGERKEEAALV